MTEPHPQRCETCEYSSFNAPGKTCPFVIKAPYVAVVLHCNMAFMASVVGCASHSSSDKSSDKVLEKAWVRIETMAPYEGTHLGWVLLSDVKAVLNGLRQQGREQG